MCLIEVTLDVAFGRSGGGERRRAVGVPAMIDTFISNGYISRVRVTVAGGPRYWWNDLGR